MNTNRLLHLLKDLARVEKELNAIVDEIQEIVSVDINERIKETLIAGGNFESGQDNV